MHRRHTPSGDYIEDVKGGVEVQRSTLLCSSPQGGLLHGEKLEPCFPHTVIESWHFPMALPLVSVSEHI
jgi:hypothetical protein